MISMHVLFVHLITWDHVSMNILILQKVVLQNKEQVASVAERENGF